MLTLEMSSVLYKKVYIYMAKPRMAGTSDSILVGFNDKAIQYIYIYIYICVCVYRQQAGAGVVATKPNLSPSPPPHPPLSSHNEKCPVIVMKGEILYCKTDFRSVRGTLRSPVHIHVERGRVDRRLGGGHKLSIDTYTGCGR
jgi:hypothetical protein